MIPQETFRFERKAYVDQLDHCSLVSLIHQHPAFFQEIHHERAINSLYFDTRTFSNAFEKVDGLISRRKARIRWYGDLFGEINQPVLEIKAKENSVVWKRRYPLRPFVLEISGDESAIRPEFERPEDALHPRVLLMSRIPTLLVSYRRRYFLSADRRFRVTMDYPLKFYHRGMNKRRWISSLDKYPATIIELKYAQEDDNDARNITCWFPFRWGSFSKYLTGLQSIL
jgi:SPX domain protein involved in polyphosphate accumulation